MGVVGKLPGQGQDSFGLVEIELSYRLWHGGSKKRPDGRTARPSRHCSALGVECVTGGAYHG
jgi:hypothetical protein